MTLFNHIFNTFHSDNITIDSMFRGKIKNVKNAFEKNYPDEPKKVFDKWVQHYILLCRYNNFWEFEPGKFLYRFRTLDYKQPALGYLDDFEPCSADDIREVGND